VTSERVRVHLDTDFGGDIDDLCALALLLGSTHVEITGITTCIENGGQRAAYARYVLDLAERQEIPVAAGAEVALGRYRETEYGLPEPGAFWPASIEATPGLLGAALDLLERSIDRGATIVAIGPLTNLALLEERRPGPLARADVVLMGGHVHPAPTGFPDWDHTVDFNLQTDVEAARTVIEAAAPDRLTFVPIEATVQTALRKQDLARLDGAGAVGALIARQARAFAMEHDSASKYAPYEGLPDDFINFQHDPLACGVALGWPGVEVERVHLETAIEDGWIRTRPAVSGKAVRIARGVDQDGFASYWLDAIEQIGVRPRGDA
jgi:inosine-uridine nucleoside N-ribohydrolase